VKERPILFKGEMVRAILEGRKTQTRRVVKEACPTWDRIFCDELTGCATIGVYADDGSRVRGDKFVCPYGKKGDRLWVRETWKVGAWRDGGQIAVDYKASPDLGRTPWCFPPRDKFAKLAAQSFEDCETAFDNDDPNIWEGEKPGMAFMWEVGNSPCRVRPSIHMPRWASRIDLEVTGVRVERVQDITEDDAREEGICDSHPEGCCDGDCINTCWRVLWDSINKARGFGWSVNPWVWVVEFKRI